MGKLYLTLMVVLLSLHVDLLQAGPPVLASPPILFMPPAPAIPPPPPDPQRGTQDLERLRAERLKRTPPPPEGGPYAAVQAKRNHDLAEEAQKARDYRLMMQVSLAYPVIKVTGPRRAYTTEPTSHFSSFFRLPTRLPATATQLWWGLRLAPFAGTGVYEQTAGRYGFLYFGPMLGLGKISQPTEARDQGEAKVAAGRSRLIFLQRQAWFLMVGIAAQHRSAARDPSTPAVNKDLDSQGVRLDGTGLWAEFSYASIHFGAVGLHYTAGVQGGEGKLFAWVGLAAGAWY